MFVSREHEIAVTQRAAQYTILEAHERFSRLTYEQQYLENVYNSSNPSAKKLKPLRYCRHNRRQFFLFTVIVIVDRNLKR